MKVTYVCTVCDLRLDEEQWELRERFRYKEVPDRAHDSSHVHEWKKEEVVR